MPAIDTDFQTTRQKVGDHNGHDVWGPVSPPTQLGIHGTKVAVDFDLCTGDGACVDACPETIFEMIDTPGHPTSAKKADPIKQDTCLSCMACESVCPVSAIKITM